MTKKEWFFILFMIVFIPSFIIIGGIFELEMVCMGILFVSCSAIIVQRIIKEHKMPNRRESNDKLISHEQMYGSNPLDPFNYVKTDHRDPFE